MSEMPQANRATTDEQKQAVIERLYTLWCSRPELRFGQLLGNVFREIYFIEDGEMVQRLEHFYASSPAKGDERERD